jgi:hypothetical protein
MEFKRTTQGVCRYIVVDLRVNQRVHVEHAAARSEVDCTDVTGLRLSAALIMDARISKLLYRGGQRRTVDHAQ